MQLPAIVKPVSHLRAVCAILAIAAALMATASRLAAQSLLDNPSHVLASILVDRTPVAAGQDATLAVVLNIDDGWHVQSAVPYQENFIATRVTFEPSPGMTFGTPKYPVGLDDKSGVETISLYSGKVIVLVPFTIAPDAPAGVRKVSAKLETQACSDVTKSCDPPVETPLFVELTVAPPGAASLQRNQKLLEQAAAQTFYTADQIASRGKPTTRAAATIATTSGLPGVDVTLLSEADQIALIEKRPYAPAREETYPLWLLVVFALMGGAILNIMPCVLPVVPLKVLGLVQQAHGDRRLSLLHAGAFAAGIITLFIILGIALKTLGFFYGQQFQSTGFLVAMAYVVLALALSMMGVWTLNPPRAVYAIDQPRTGYAGSFMNGLLATLLATPCSGPYLGPVLTWALVQPAWVTMIGLALVGVGMAVPYVVLAAFPEGLKRLPTAGRWAELLKQGLGLFMVAVAVFLITRIANVMYWPGALFGAMVVAGVCWAWGQIPSPTAEPARIWTIRLIAAVIGAALGFGLYVISSDVAVTAAKPGAAVVRLPEKSDGRTWLPFNVALLDEGLRQSRPVVIDWTADWCINCKTVERLVLETDEVKRAFESRNVVMLRADLTGPNEPAKKLNGKLHGQSIPVLAIFSPASPHKPVVLRDVYGKGTVIEDVGKAGAAISKER